MFTDWEQVLLAYLHDPPNKAFDIPGHESRAAALASIACGRDVDRGELHRETRTEDQLGAASERLPAWLTFQAMRPILDAVGPAAAGPAPPSSQEGLPLALEETAPDRPHWSRRR